GGGGWRVVVEGAPAVLPLICYEIIFPDEAVPQGERPGWLLNVTNDGWFGNSSGPYQHFQQARVRAIEQGLPLVRAANTGISAVVDPFGRILEQLPLGAEGLIDSGLPERIEPTLYLRAGIIFVKVVCARAVFLVVRRRRGARCASRAAFLPSPGDAATPPAIQDRKAVSGRARCHARAICSPASRWRKAIRTRFATGFPTKWWTRSSSLRRGTAGIRARFESPARRPPPPTAW